MEKKYRELFDEVHASARLRTEVMDMTEEKRPRRLHAALATALVAVALTGTVLAAGAATGFDIVHFFNREKSMTLPDENGEDREVQVVYEVGSEGMIYFPEADMPEAYHAAKQEGADDPDITFVGNGSVYLNKTTWAEAEDFLGLELANSRVIEEQGYLDRFAVKYADSSDTYQYNVCLNLGMRGVNRVRADFGVYYELEGRELGERDLVWVRMEICILTDAVAPDMRDNDWTGVVHDSQSGEWEYTREEYVTASGMETVIIKMWDTEKGIGFYDGVFVLNGMGYQLSVGGWHGEALLKEVLDGFQ